MFYCLIQSCFISVIMISELEIIVRKIIDRDDVLKRSRIRIFQFDSKSFSVRVFFIRDLCLAINSIKFFLEIGFFGPKKKSLLRMTKFVARGNEMSKYSSR